MLTTNDALVAYAKMMNTLDGAEFIGLLTDDFKYTSQAVLSDITNKEDFVAYIKPKLNTIKQSNIPVYAELGCLNNSDVADCVLLAQSKKDDLVATVLINMESGKIKQVNICIVPPPNTAKRTGVYPS